MRENYPQILSWLGLSEGGYVNHPNDPGGPTDRGITQRTYDAWNKLHGIDKRPVKGIRKEVADEILASQYLDTVKADVLPSGLDYAVADYSVNSGPSRAVKDLQRCLGVAADGVIGAQTLAAVEGADVQQLIVNLCDRRLAFMKSLRTWKTFGRGWTTRVMGARSGVQSDDVGVIDRACRMAHGATLIPDPKTAQGRADGAMTLLAFILSLFGSKQ